MESPLNSHTPSFNLLPIQELPQDNINSPDPLQNKQQKINHPKNNNTHQKSPQQPKFIRQRKRGSSKVAQDLYSINNNQNKKNQQKNNIFSKGLCFYCCRKNQNKTTHNNASDINNRKKQSIMGNLTLKHETLIQNLQDLNQKERYDKAVRHFWDGYLYRSVRHDFDKQTQWVIRYIWQLQNSSIWNKFNLFLSCLYLLQSFIEPGNRLENRDQSSETYMFIFETFIMIIWWLDIILDLVQKKGLYGSIIKALYKNKKQSLRLIFFLIVFSDYLYFYYIKSTQKQVLRFARIFRPLQTITFSKQLRRNIKGIIFSVKGIIIIFFFYIIIICMWAFLGNMLIGQINEEVKYDKFAFDYSSFGKTSASLYMLSTFDLFPDLMIPPLQSSQYYTLYFIPFIVLFLIVFQPIPVAVVYEGFRKHRVNIVIEDRIKRRDALLCSFLSIDYDSNGYLDSFEFAQVFQKIYQSIYQENMAKQISYTLYKFIDYNNNKKISIEEYFRIIDVIETNPQFSLNHYKSPEWWFNLKYKVNEKFNLDQFIEGTFFNIFIFIITLLNCALVIIQFFINEDEKQDLIDIMYNLELFFFIVYVIEFIMKFLALGYENYFKDNWNKFDFFLILFQAIFYIALENFMSSSADKSLAASRVIKIAKIQKVFRLFRALRTVKILSFLAVGLEIFSEVKKMFLKIALCMPIVFKLTSIIFIIFYIYAAIGVEIFTTSPPTQYTKNSPYEYDSCIKNKFDFEYSSTDSQAKESDQQQDKCQQLYGGFNTYGQAFLMQLQVCMHAGWSYIVYDYAYKFSFLQSLTFFFTLHFLCIYLLALITGMVWEVFNALEEEIKNRDDQHIESQQDEQENDDLEHAFNIVNQHEELRMMKQIHSRIGNRQSIAQQALELRQFRDPSYTNPSSILSPRNKQKFLKNKNLRNKSKSEGTTKLNQQQVESPTKKQKTPKNNFVQRQSRVSVQSKFIDLILQAGQNEKNALQNKQNKQKKLKFLEKLKNHKQVKKTYVQVNGTQDKKHQKNLTQQLFKKLQQKHNSKLSRELQQLNNPLFNDASDLEFTSNDDLHSDSDSYPLIQSHRKNSHHKKKPTIISLLKPPKNDLNTSQEIPEESSNVRQALYIQTTTVVDLPSQPRIFSQQSLPLINNNNINNNQSLIETPPKNLQTLVKNNNFLRIQLPKQKLESYNSLTETTQNISLKQNSNSYLNSKNNLINSINSLQQPSDKQIYSFQQELQNEDQLIIEHYQCSIITLKQAQQNALISRNTGFIENLDHEEVNDLAKMIKQDLRKCIELVTQKFNQNKLLDGQQQQQQQKNKTQQNALLNQAILKGENSEKIEKREIEYFKSLYGNKFQNLMNQDLIPIWTIQQKTLFHLKNILKLEQFSVKFFFQILLSIEQQISSILKTKKCFCKFIFKPHKSQKWFTLRYRLEKFHFEKLSHGPWTHFPEIFDQKLEQCLIQFNAFKQHNLHSRRFNNFLLGNLQHQQIKQESKRQKSSQEQYQNPLIKQYTKKFYSSIQQLSDNYLLENTNIDTQQSSNVLFVPLKNMKIDQTIKDLRQQQDFLQEQDSDTEEDDDDDDDQSQTPSPQNNQHFQSQHQQHLLSDSQPNSMFSSQQNSQQPSLLIPDELQQTRDNIEDSIIENIMLVMYMDKNIKGKHAIKQSSKYIKGGSLQKLNTILQKNETKQKDPKDGLSIQYMIDLAEDIKDIIVQNQHNFFLKTSELLYYKNSYQYM